jgi:sugar phosphate isomerase/epimerase
MNHALSTHLFVGHRLTSVWFEKIWNAGIPAIEIFCARQHFDYLDTAQVRELSHWFRDSQLKVRSLHSPMYRDEVWGRSGPQAIVDITEPEKRRRIISVDEVKRAIEVAELIPFEYLVQHLGVSGQEYDERRIEAAFTALEEVSVFARQRGVEILLENIPNALSSAERLMLFNEQTHLNMNFAFDVGHAHMAGSIEAAWSVMADRVRSTHVHDNNGVEDQHLFPLLPGDAQRSSDREGAVASRGTIDWRKTMALLRSRQDRYPLLLELKEVAGMANPISVARDTLQRLEELPAQEGRE